MARPVVRVLPPTRHPGHSEGPESSKRLRLRAANGPDEPAAHRRRDPVHANKAREQLPVQLTGEGSSDVRGRRPPPTPGNCAQAPNGTPGEGQIARQGPRLEGPQGPRPKTVPKGEHRPKEQRQPPLAGSVVALARAGRRQPAPGFSACSGPVQSSATTEQP